MKSLKMAAIAAALALLGACGQGDNPGGLSDEENAELNNAAEMLDASPDSLVADDVELGTEETSAETGDVAVAEEGANAGAGNSQ